MPPFHRADLCVGRFPQGSRPGLHYFAASRLARAISDRLSIDAPIADVLFEFASWNFLFADRLFGDCSYIRASKTEVLENCLVGAEAPKRSSENTSPLSPTYFDHPSAHPASTATRAFYGWRQDTFLVFL